jgi:8-amino-7-oxononanoate synthase
MMRSLKEEREEIIAQGLWRKLTQYSNKGTNVINEELRRMKNFAANDYLGLASHAGIAEAFVEGLRTYGHGATASRLICGTSPAHRALEDTIAEMKTSERALLFSTGFAAATGTIPALLQRGDFVILDKLSHACLIDAARLSGATLRVFPHNDSIKLEKILQSVRAQHGNEPRILIVTESVFSMDGDLAPLVELVRLKEKYDALLLVDDAHGFGVFGEQGAGLAEQLGLQKRIDLQMGTLSKAAGLAGGFIASSSVIIDLLINRARSFIYSTAPPPALAHAACQALAIIRSEEGRRLRQQLQNNIVQFTAGTIRHGHQTPIIPWILGGNDQALSASAALNQAGFLVPAIRFPTVPRNTARLRVSLSASHSHDEIDQLKNLLVGISG